jgi:hypothetical protein
MKHRRAWNVEAVASDARDRALSRQLTERASPHWRNDCGRGCAEVASDCGWDRGDGEEGIKDLGPVKVMLESGIELDDVLYTLGARSITVHRTERSHRGPSTSSYWRLRKPMGGGSCSR